MINIKIKCDAHHYAYERDSERTLSEAAENCWWEIEIHPGSVAFRQPKTPESFIEGRKHACSPNHARQIIQTEIEEMIPDKVLEMEGS